MNIQEIKQTEFKKSFHGRGNITKGELFEFFRSYQPYMSKSAFNWHIQDLLKKNKLQTVRRGVYSASIKQRFIPFFSTEVKIEVFEQLQKFDDLNVCIWNTQWLNEFTIHQIMSNYTVIEVEKDMAEEVFNTLSENPTNKTFFDPGSEIMERYVRPDSLIIKPIISRAPTQKITQPFGCRKINVPTLEKILVDIFSDPVTYYQIQGSECTSVFNYAFRLYTINMSKLMHYAQRRGKKNELHQYLEKISGSLLERN